MTTTDPTTPTSTDFEVTLRLRATPDAVFEAITTTAGLAAWWNPATGNGETGGELRFHMNAPEPLVIRVDEAARPSFVRWHVTDCPFLTDWVDTRPTFAITSIDDKTSQLHFVHHGLNEELECLDMCARSWNHYMESLRQHLEGLGGSPFGSPADLARREAQAATEGSR